MIYILETELLENKTIFFAFTRILGIGHLQSFTICKNLGLSNNCKLSTLKPDQIVKLIKFIENSNLLINSSYKKSKIITISDDSGLCVDCLNNKPGIYSARWAKNLGGFKPAMKKIIHLINLKNKNKFKNTKAKFICSLTLQLTINKKITVIGEIKGNISDKILGNNGFGFDSIFIPNGHKLTFGQMSKKKKILLDHRFIAFKKLKRKINTL